MRTKEFSVRFRRLQAKGSYRSNSSHHSGRLLWLCLKRVSLAKRAMRDPPAVTWPLNADMRGKDTSALRGERCKRLGVFSTFGLSEKAAQRRARQQESADQAMDKISSKEYEEIQVTAEQSPSNSLSKMKARKP